MASVLLHDRPDVVCEASNGRDASGEEAMVGVRGDCLAREVEMKLLKLREGVHCKKAFNICRHNYSCTYVHAYTGTHTGCYGDHLRSVSIHLLH